MRKTIVVAMSAAALASGSLFAEDHVVTFRRIDGTILERRTVPHGGTTTLPAAPSVQHFRFKEWDRAERLACVTNALDLWALYENDGSKTWAANTKIESKSIAERDEQYTLEEYFKMYNNLEWTDEFSRGSNTAVSVNTSNWGYDTENRDQYSCETSGNNQAETNGYLALTVRREPWTRWGKSYNFTSGGIRSDNKVAFRYGRCEVRAKLTRMPGVAPAFWMMGSGYNTYPKNGEIDIFEQPSGGEWAGANMHVPTPGVQYKSIQNSSQCAPPDGVHFGDGFHRFGIIINERELVYYVDNHIFKRIDARDDRYEMIRRCYQFIILGVGIDDGWLKDGPGLALSESDIPADFQSVDFLVDYCRIYTNTKENNTVALEPPPAAAKLSGPVKSAVWYGQSLIWGMPGYQVMTRNIDKLGWSSMYIDMYTRTAIETFVKQEKPDVITFLTMPSQGPTSNTTPFAAPGMSSISISANANFTNSYYIGLFEVTVGQYALMQDPSAEIAVTADNLRTKGNCRRSAVRGISDAPAAFGAGITVDSPLGRLNALAQDANGDGRLVFDLPNEAMWEVAARAMESGNDAHKDWKYYFGTNDADIALYAFNANRGDADEYGFTSSMRVPGCRLPNAWGLYDMCGNAFEVCLDVDSSATDDWSLAPHAGGSYQRLRGGGYNTSNADSTSSARSYHDGDGYGHSGIRLARICTDAEEIPRATYTITLKDEDGTVLQQDEVAEGSYVRYRDILPRKARSGDTFYRFKAWTPSVSTIAVGDAAYTAVYSVSDVVLPDDYETAGWVLEDNDWTLRSKAIDHNGSTEVSLAVTGPGSLTFRWKASSEGNYDFLRFYRGDSQLATISGTTDWAFVSNRVDEAGTVTFRWAYTKDGSTVKGSDCGWVRDIVWLPDAQGTQVFVNGESVEFERGEDGRSLTAEASAGTSAENVSVKVDGIDVSRGFSCSVEGTVVTATLLAPYAVPKDAGIPNDMWTDNGDGTVTINVTVVPGLYYAATSADSLHALACPGASAPATAETTLVVPKPVGDKGFFQVWVSDAPILAEP